MNIFTITCTYVGTLPSSLGQLSGLTLLDFRSNLLRGSLPPEIGQLSQLEGLTLSHNQLSGTIPFQLGDAISLTAFDVHNNSITGSLPISFGNMSNLAYLDIRGTGMTGHLGEFLCPLNSLSSIYFDRPVCYAYCLGDSVLAYGTSFDPNPIRCQSPEDLAMCAMLQTTDIGQYINVTVPKIPICSPGNYTHCANTNLTSTHRQLSSINREVTFSVPNAVQLNIYFNDFTDFVPQTLVFCDTPSCGVVYYNYSSQPLENLPGLQQLLPSVPIPSSQFFMHYKSNGCGVLSQIQVACWGYTLYVDAYIPLNLHGNWKCTAPPSPEVAFLPSSSPFWKSNEVPYSESYAGNFNGWTGVTAIADIIATLDLSGIGLYGSIPTNIGLLKSLQILSLFDNHMTGRLPRSLLLLTDLRELQLSINSFSGVLNGSALGQFKNLEVLGLGSNAFTGPLPTQIIVGRKNVENQIISHAVDLSSNHFTGQLPESLCSLNYTTLDVSGNQLGCWASCWAPRIASRQVLVGNLPECQPSVMPTGMPTMAPAFVVTNTTILVLSVCIGIGLPFAVFCLGGLYYCFIWRNRKKKARKAIWRSLPPHKAIAKKKSIDDILKVSNRLLHLNPPSNCSMIFMLFHYITYLFFT